MSDQANFASPETSTVDLGGTVPTAGGLLKVARQAAGLDLVILSVCLKVPVRQLEALEANQFLNDQGLVFFRALASSVSRHLRIDPAPILALMPVSDHPPLVGPGLRHAFPASGQTGRLRQTRYALPNRMGWLALAMVALIAVLIWWPGTFSWRNFWTESAKPQEAIGGSVSTVIEAIALGEPTPSGVNTNGTLHPLAATPMLPSLVTPDSASASTSAPTNAPDLLFSAQSTSWIEVREANQRVLWTGVLNAGDTQRLNAARALSVVVGRADAIQVSFKGQPLDLAPYTQVNVARFEVKP